MRSPSIRSAAWSMGAAVPPSSRRSAVIRVKRAAAAAIGTSSQALEGRHDLRREALELLENYGLRRPDRLPDVDDLETGVLVLDLHQLLRDLLGRADQPRAGLDGIAKGRQVGLTGPLRVGDRLDLLGGEAGHEPERREHLDVLLEERRRFLDPLVDAVGDVERKADAEVAAQLGLASGAGARLAEGVDDLLIGPAGRRAPADDA